MTELIVIDKFTGERIGAVPVADAAAVDRRRDAVAGGVRRAGARRRHTSGRGCCGARRT